MPKLFMPFSLCLWVHLLKSVTFQTQLPFSTFGCDTLQFLDGTTTDILINTKSNLS